MALLAKHNEIDFGVGDAIKVHLKVKDGEKARAQVFEGMVIAIKNRDTGKSFTVRRIGAAKVGIEMIFPLNTPSIEKVEVIRKGTEGVQHAKLYYVRNKSTREIERIYSRVAGKNAKIVTKKKKVVKKVASKEVKLQKKTSKK